MGTWYCLWDPAFHKEWGCRRGARLRQMYFGIWHLNKSSTTTNPCNKRTRLEAVVSTAAIRDRNFDFKSFFEETRDSKSDIYDKLNSIGCTFVTTNYDLYLQPTVSESLSGDESQPDHKRIVSPENFPDPNLMKSAMWFTCMEQSALQTQ